MYRNFSAARDLNTSHTCGTITVLPEAVLPEGQAIQGRLNPESESKTDHPMLLQTNSYIVPKEKRAEHARLMRRFRQVLHHLGCDNFEVHEQVGANWSSGSATGRFVQIMRFRDRKHQLAVQNAERTDPTAQELIAEFCELVNYPYQQQNGMFAVGFYSSVLPVAPIRPAPQVADEARAAAAAVPMEGQEQEQEVAPEQEGEVSEQAETAVAEDVETQAQTKESEGVDVEEGSVVEGEALPDEEAAAAEMAGAQGGAFGEKTSAQTPFAMVEDQPVGTQAGEGDEWSVMDQAQSIQDTGEEALGVELETEAPANGEQEPEPEPQIDLGLDHQEEQDDLAEMADRLAEGEDEDADANADAGAGAPSASDKRAGRGR
jgi:hypothetical protein